VTSAAGLDPNQWFNNVELMAARDIGHETVNYVSNIYKYYIAYRLVLEKSTKRQKGL
jgi:hypothetical protein